MGCSLIINVFNDPQLAVDPKNSLSGLASYGIKCYFSMRHYISSWPGIRLMYLSAMLFYIHNSPVIDRCCFFLFVCLFQIENRDLEQKVRELQGRIVELEHANETLKARLNTSGTKARMTPSKRGIFAKSSC